VDNDDDDDDDDNINGNKVAFIFIRWNNYDVNSRGTLYRTAGDSWCFTNSVTNTVLQKLIVPHLITKFPAFMLYSKFPTVF